MGFDDSDFANGGSDRLIDNLAAWGSADKLNERITAHEAAGASRVIVLPFDTGTKDPWASQTLNTLAPGI